jgi:hypothetical protein
MSQGLPPENPATEPEIIPPGRDDAGLAGDKSRLWIAVRTRRVGAWRSVPTFGPFAVILVLLVVGMLAAVTLLILLGTILLWIPVLAVLFALLFVAGVLRGHFRGTAP